MTTIAIAVLCLWALYAWKIAVALSAMSMLIALFYAGALDGYANEKVLKAFCILVFALSAAMVGVLATPPEGDAPEIKYCGSVQC